MSGIAETLPGADAPELSYVEVISSGVGTIATAGAAEIDTPSQYRYELTYDRRGRIEEAHSWKYNAETDETTFTRFDADGNQLSRYVKCPSLGTDCMYDGNDKLVSSSRNENDGKIVERISYGPDEQPISSSVIDREANTHTMTLFQRNGTQYVVVTPWEGADGWTSTAYPPPSSRR